MTKKLLLLTRTRERLLVPGQWTQNSMARDSKGECTHPSTKNAVCWCLVGALMREKHLIQASGTDYTYVTNLLYSFSYSHGGLIPYNDQEGRTVEDIITLLDEGIAKAKLDEAEEQSH